MRKKLISTTYLRDVNKHNLKLYLGEKDFYLSVKEIIEVKIPFIVSNGLTLIDNGYYVLELIPKNENYSMRVYFNEKKEILDYYFDISLENGMDLETKIPYYDDLYLDVTFTNGEIKILDEDELNEALFNGNISKEEYELAHKTKDNLVEELKTKTNRFVNMNLKEFL